MFLIFPHSAGGARRSEIHVVDERGRLRVVCPTVEYALRWLYGRGHRQIGTPAGREVDVFLIERRPDGEAGPGDLSIRRDPSGKASGEAVRRRLGVKRMHEIRRAIAYSTDPNGLPV